MGVFFGKINKFKKLWKKITNLYVLKVNWAYAPVSSSQWTESDACILKTVGGAGSEVTGNVTFQERGFYNKYYKKLKNNTSRTHYHQTEGILV